MNLFLLVSSCLAEEPLYQSAFVDNDSLGLIKATFKSILIIIFLLLFLFFWYRKILPNIQSIQQTGNIKLLERMHLDPTTVIYLLEIGDTIQILASSNKNIQPVASFSRKDIKLKTASSKKKETFADYLKDIEVNNLWLKIKKKWHKKNG